MTTDLQYACAKVRARISHDKKSGHTTSTKAVQFIQATCSCVHCHNWRSGVRAAGPALSLVQR